MTLNEIIAATPDGGTAALPPGEFEGPVVIGRPVTLRGNNTTIWAKHGSVITVTSPNAALEGLRVEITEGDLSETAIEALCPVRAADIEVLGSVKGFGGEDGISEIPRTIQLGELSADGENTFRMTVDIPAAARLVCNAAGIRFTPENIPAGRSEVALTVTGSGSPALVYTEILVESKLRRRIYLCGRFTAGAPAVKDRVIFEAPPVSREQNSAAVGNITLTMPQAQKSATAAPKPSTDVITDVGAAPLPENAPLLELRKGQRVPLAQYVGSSCEIYLTGRKLGTLDIDPYVFMLNEREQSFGDGGLVFFGNEQSPDGAVRYHPDDGHVSVDFTKVDDNVRRITVAYSVYSGDSAKNFSLVAEPRFSLYSAGKERVRFDLDGLSGEVTVVAAEFYIYKGEWRVSAVGAGYRDGLVKLCNRYGIEVSG